MRSEVVGHALSAVRSAGRCASKNSAGSARRELLTMIPASISDMLLTADVTAVDRPALMTSTVAFEKPTRRTLRVSRPLHTCHAGTSGATERLSGIRIEATRSTL
jgi:hypothetical protein